MAIFLPRFVGNVNTDTIQGATGRTVNINYGASSGATSTILSLQNDGNLVWYDNSGSSRVAFANISSTGFSYNVSGTFNKPIKFNNIQSTYVSGSSITTSKGSTIKFEDPHISYWNTDGTLSGFWGFGDPIPTFYYSIPVAINNALVANNALFRGNGSNGDSGITLQVGPRFTNGTYISGIGIASDTGVWPFGICRVSDQTSLFTVDCSGNTFANGAFITNESVHINGPAGTNRQIIFQTSGTTRWVVAASPMAESGSNVGSRFVINSFADDGTALTTALAIDRDTSMAHFAGAISAQGMITSENAITAKNSQMCSSGATDGSVFGLIRRTNTDQADTGVLSLNSAGTWKGEWRFVVGGDVYTPAGDRFLRTTEPSGVRLTDRSNVNRAFEFGFDTNFTYLDLHAMDSSDSDYTVRLAASKGASADGATGGGNLDIDLAWLNVNGGVNLNNGAWVRGSHLNLDTGYNLYLLGASTASNTTNGQYNTSNLLDMSIPQRGAGWYTRQWAEEHVGDYVAHIIQVNGVSNYYYKFHHDGHFECGSTYANYGDLAELYVSKEDYSPGTFVTITEDDTQDFEIEAAQRGDYLFGVISTEPGLLINTKLKKAELKHSLPVALTGRVPARIKGPIRKGQPVGLSDVSGVGIYNRHRPIGFALETNLQEGEKLVEIAIGGRG